MNPDVLLNRIRLEQRGLIDIHKKLYEMEHLLPVPDPMHQKRLCHRLPMPTGAGLTSQTGVLRRRSFFHRMLPLQTQQQA